MSMSEENHCAEQGNTKLQHALDAAPPADIVQAQDVPPDGGYGWVCVACVFWINAHTWGINGTYGVFLSYYLSHDVFPGTSALFYAFTGGLGMSCALLIAPLATYHISLHGNRVALHVGIFFQTLSLFIASCATESWQLLLGQGIVFGMGMGFLFTASVGIIPQWFAKKRSLANGIASSGCGIGGLIYSLATGALLSSVGMAWAFRFLALVSLVVNLVCANAIRDRNMAVGSQYNAIHLGLVRRPEFLLLVAWGVLSMLGYVALLFSLPDFARSIGLTASEGSIVGALHNLGQGLGRPLIGYASDRFGRINVATLFTCSCAVLCFLVWIFAHNIGVLFVFAIASGAVSGTFWATVSPVLVEVIGLIDLPGALSIVWLVLFVPCTLSEAIALDLRDSGESGNSYLRVQVFIGFMYSGAAACLWIVRGWKVMANDRLEQEILPSWAASTNYDGAGRDGRGSQSETARHNTCADGSGRTSKMVKALTCRRKV